MTTTLTLRYATLLLLSVVCIISACTSTGTLYFRTDRIAIQGSYTVDVVEHPPANHPTHFRATP